MVDYDPLLDLVTELAFALQMAGAEIFRVEESVGRVLEAYGVSTGEVFAIPNCIIISLATQTGHAMTRVCRVPPHGTDINRLEAINDCCRKLCSQTPPLEVARAELVAAGKDSAWHPRWRQALAYFIGACFFCLFFGGTWQDALCSGLCGSAIGGCRAVMNRQGGNPFFKTIAGGAVSALLALGLVAAGFGQNIDIITIGALMILVPGVALTNSIRDIMAGDMISGISKLGEALLVATAIALGTGVAMTLAQWMGGGV